jgi:hypothetical protein
MVSNPRVSLPFATSAEPIGEATIITAACFGCVAAETNLAAASRQTNLRNL